MSNDIKLDEALSQRARVTIEPEEHDKDRETRLAREAAEAGSNCASAT